MKTATHQLSLFTVKPLDSSIIVELISGPSANDQCARRFRRNGGSFMKGLKITQRDWGDPFNELRMVLAE
ncbi:hypothetical protein KA005_29860, partial [bacterium]|nr:hypothetical protein [bacterium]